VENLKVPVEYCHGTGGSALYAPTPGSDSAGNKRTRSCIVVVVVVGDGGLV